MSPLRALVNCSGPVKTESMNEFYEAFARQGLRHRSPTKSMLVVCHLSVIMQSPAEWVNRVAVGIFNPNLGLPNFTFQFLPRRTVQRHELLENGVQIEREIRASVFADLGLAVRFLFLKPPRWIVKSTAGKTARSTTREKLLREHPDLAGCD
jgi:hypothetical protein